MQSYKPNALHTRAKIHKEQQPMPDFPQATFHPTPSQYWFNSVDPVAIVLHETGGDRDLPHLFNTFNTSDRSAHYGIGTDDNGVDGACWQFVPESHGAGANCCLEAGHDPFWDSLINQYGNLNLCTLSVEHCTADLQNMVPLTQAQVRTSFALVAYWVKRYQISLSNIKGHSSLDPLSRKNCPGPYFPWAELMRFLKGGSVNAHQRAAFEAEWTALVPARVDSGIAAAPGRTTKQGCFVALLWNSSKLTIRQGNRLPIGAETRLFDKAV